MLNHFGLIGAAGYIAPRHMQAIQDTGNKLAVAMDVHDSVGIMDRYSLETAFYTDIELFEKHVRRQNQGAEEFRINYVSICSPNFLHETHIRLALRSGAHAICEKPIVISPSDIEPLLDLEQEVGRKIYNVLQLRVHPTIVKLKQVFEAQKKTEKPEIELSYVTRRGPWYRSSWKGDDIKSGGVAMNVGVHFFDMLMWIYGKRLTSEVHLRQDNKVAGYLELESARVKWFLSVDEADLPQQCVEKGQPAYRSIAVDGQEIEFSGGFTDLHTLTYKGILEGYGFGLRDSRTAIEIVDEVRSKDISVNRQNAHPKIK